MSRRFESHGAFERDVEALREPRRDEAVALRLDFEPHGRQQAALFQHVAHLRDVVLAVVHFLVVGVDVGVARHGENGAVDDRVVRENLVEVRLDELFLQDVRHAVARRNQETRQ